MGVVFYELATLHHPYKVVNDGDVTLWKEAHLYTIPENANNINRNVSPTIASLIMKMLEKSTSKRFENWDEIIKYLATNKEEKADIDGIIDSMLNSRLQKDNTLQKEIAEEQRKKKENTDFCKLVRYQFDTAIVPPLNEFINRFNSKYPSGVIRIQSNYRDEKSSKITIKLVSGKELDIEIVALLEKDFTRSREINDYGEKIRRTETKMPLLNNRKIFAWGRLNSTEQTGFNIFLLEKSGEIYGEWFLMENTNSGLGSRRPRPEPFGFELSELEKEIQYIKTISAYNSKILPLEIDMFFQYVLKYNN